MRRRWGTWLLILGAIGWSSPVAAAPSRLLSIRVVPEEVVLWGAKASQRILVLGKFGDGLERDVTAESRITIADPSLAGVEAEGRVAGLADGETWLSAEFRGQAAKIRLRIAASRQSRPFSFARDIGGIFTRRGCNGSDCHGSVVGRGGFKLSSDALDPKEDYRWLIEGGVYSVFTVAPKAPSPPRINLEQPEQSLLLLKPTFAVPHGGGSLFSRGSEDYRTILDWVRNGAPFGQADARIERLEIFPAQPVLDLNGKQNLLLLAHRSGGRREDASGQARYESVDRDVAEVSAEGVIRAKKAGETPILIHVAGHAPVGIRVGIAADPLVEYPTAPRNNLIDDHVFRRLRQLSIIPSRLSSDAEFLRRLCLDVTGTLPPPERVREFLADKDPGKREKLIKTLLDSPEYVDYWTFRFADLFRVNAFAQNAIAKASQTYWEWIRDSVARNKPYDQLARERIAVQGYDGPVMHYQSVDEFRSPEDIMAEQARVFLGRRLDCAQCHNHPYEAWTQNQFWGMAAFFSRLTRLWDQVDFVLIDYPGGHGKMGKGFRMVHPRTKKEVQPRFLDGTALPGDQLADPRMRLAEWMTSHPYFAEAAVNRMWSYFFGRGLVDPVDDFRLANPSTHPALLAALARDFREHEYDLKSLIGRIVESRTYQLSHAPNETNKDDRLNYSRALSRPLDAEVLWDAINQFAGVEEDSEKWRGGRASTRTRAINLMTPDLFPSQFLQVYGRPNRLTVPQRKSDPNLGQALHMLAGPTYTSKIAIEEGRVARLLKAQASDRRMIEEFYLAALSRFPTPAERDAIRTWIGRRSRREALEDLAWSLISSREFAYNH